MSSRLPIVLALILATGAAACGSSDDGKPAPAGAVTGPAEPEDAISQELMLALAQAKNFHHKARVYMSDGKLDPAIASVRSILAIPFPAGAPEAEDVVADARALLAKLLIGKGELDAAMSELDAGLAQATRESFFVANLYTVKGEVLQAQAEVLAASVKPDDVTRTRELRKQAIVAFDQSIAINERLQKKLMERRE